MVKLEGLKIATMAVRLLRSSRFRALIILCLFTTNIDLALPRMPKTHLVWALLAALGSREDGFLRSRRKTLDVNLKHEPVTPLVRSITNLCTVAFCSLFQHVYEYSSLW